MTGEPHPPDVSSSLARGIGSESGAQRPRPNVHAVLCWLLIGLCVYFAWHGVHAGLRAQGSDFTIFYDAGRAVLEGRDPSQVERFLYLPAFAVAMAPLALLPYPAALVLWQAASLAALVWIASRCRRLCERELGRPLPWLAWAPLACVLRLADSNLANGQANLLVLGLIVAALEAWLAAREPRAGALLGCATALKIVPGFLILVFLWRRSRRAALATLASVIVLVLPLTAAVIGWRVDLGGIASWFHSQLVPYLHGGRALLAEHEYLPGQSLTATAYRLLCDAPATSAGAEGPRANLVELDPEQVKWIVRGLSACALAGLAVSLSVSVKRAARAARLREAALVTCTALALAPLVHKAHMVWLILPYAVLLAGAPAGLAPLARRARWTLLAFSVLAIGATTPALLGRWLATQALAHDSVFFGLAGVTAALLVDVWGTRAETA